MEPATLLLYRVNASAQQQVNALNHALFYWERAGSGKRKITTITAPQAPYLFLTLPMLRLLSSKVQGVKIFEILLNPVVLVFIR